MAELTLPAEPTALRFDPGRTALVIIDMQRDFLEPGGFGEMLGNDIGLLARAIGPCAASIAAARAAGILVIHTREGHRPDLSDAPPAKVARGAPSKRIGDPGPMGRILVRGEPGHHIIDDLAPLPGETVINKPGKGASHQTDLEQVLRNRGIEILAVCGVTTEVCVHTTIREANDRDYKCVALGDACASYFPEFHRVPSPTRPVRSGRNPWRPNDRLGQLYRRGGRAPMGLAIAPPWRAGIAGFLGIAADMAALLAAVELDEGELALALAPVYRLPERPTPDSE